MNDTSRNTCKISMDRNVEGVKILRIQNAENFKMNETINSLDFYIKEKCVDDFGKGDDSFFWALYTRSFSVI